jgi:hypothetical protein
MILAIDAQRVYRHLVATGETLRPADRALLLDILEQYDDGPELAHLVRDYYRDGDRSDRTPRPLMYFHLGLLSAALGAS